VKNAAKFVYHVLKRSAAIGVIVVALLGTPVSGAVPEEKSVSGRNTDHSRSSHDFSLAAISFDVDGLKTEAAARTLCIAPGSRRAIPC